MSDERKPPPTDRGVTVPRHLPLSSVDYYTATTHSRSVGYGWAEIYQAYKSIAATRGDRQVAFRRHTYDCVSISHMTFGESQKYGWLLTASSDQAETTWRAVFPVAKRVTRVDLAYTFVLPGDDGFVDRLWGTVSNKSSRRSYRIIKNSSGGTTLYVGSPASDQTGRVYTKYIQEPGGWPEFTYRAEVQLRKPRSDLAGRTMIEDFQNGLSIEERVRSTVIEWFTSRYVDLGQVATTEAISLQVSREVTTDERKLKWLRTSVSPTLVDLTGRGKYEELAASLGLSRQEYEQLSLFARSHNQDEA